MKKPKVVHITTLFSKPRLPRKKRTIDLFDSHRNIWTTKFVIEQSKKYSDIDFESWSIYDIKDKNSNSIFTENKYGSTFRAFPGFRFGSVLFSPKLLWFLKNYVRRNKKCIIHLQSIYSLKSYLVSMISRNNPLIFQQRGPAAPPQVNYRFLKDWRFLFLHHFEKLTLNFRDHIFACSIGEYNYTKTKLGKNRTTLAKGGGFFFEKYKLMDKMEARKALNLPTDKKILITVGRLGSGKQKRGDAKGFKYILDAYKILKEDRKVLFLYVGSSSNKNEQIIEAEREGVIFLGHLKHELLMKYINAADVFSNYIDNDRDRLFCGLGTTSMESLSLNTPVVSPLLVHLMCKNVKERKRMGMIPKNPDEIANCISKVFDNPDLFSSTRGIMERYYSWDNILEINNAVYRRFL